MAIAAKKRSKHSVSIAQTRTLCTMAASTGSSLPPAASASRNDWAKASSRAAVSAGSAVSIVSWSSTMSSASRQSA
jgi:hypothetical protein